ncbi:MAG: PAS domain-containing protein [Anaerolineales bacterium]|nr:PAS domain-containing protein [Anaerolineales bacterium]
MLTSSLRFRLLILVLLAVAPAGAFMAYSATQDRAAATAAAEREALRVVRQAARDQAALIEQARQALVYLSQSPALRAGAFPACSTIYSDLRAQYLQAFPRYANLGLIAPDGAVTCSVEPVSGPINVADRPYFQHALRTLEFTIGEAVIDPARGQAFINFVYPVLDFSGQVRLMLFATLNLSWLNDLAAAADLPAGSTLSVLDSAGIILARFPEPERWVGQTFDIGVLPPDLTVGRSEGTLELTGADGVRRLFAYAPLHPQSTGANALSVNVGIPTEVVFAQANRSLLNSLLLLGLLAGAVLAGTWLGGEFLVIRPVERLLRATQRLAAGDLKARAGPAARGQAGELAQLAQAFDQMADALEQRDAVLLARAHQLQESEERYRTLAHNFPNGAVLLFDADLRYTLADGAGLAEVGLSPEALEGRTIQEVFPPEVCALLEPPFRAALAGEASAFEVPFADRLYLVHTVPVRDAAGAVTAGLVTTQDITARQQAEAERREREAQYRSIFESVSDGLFIVNPAGEIVELNPAAARNASDGPALFMPPEYHELFVPEHRAVADDLLRSVSEGVEFRSLALMPRRVGPPLLAEVLGAPILYGGRPHALVVIRDVSEVVQAQQLLEQRVDERTRQLTSLLQVARNVSSTLELEPLLSLILDELQQVVDYRLASLYVLAEDEATLVLLQERGGRDQVGERANLRDYPETREMLRRGEPLLVADVSADTPAAVQWRAAVAAHPQPGKFADIASWLGLPLRARERSLGVLNLAHDQPNYYTPERTRLALALADQAAVAIENARLYERGRDLAALEERQKLARELHDSVSQALYGIALGARTARTLLDRGASSAEALADPLDYVLSLAEAGLAEMRALIFELRPESLKTEGLVAALTKQTDSLRIRHRLEVRTAFGPEPALPLEAKEALYRVAQEAMHNIGKHARAARVDVRLESAGDCAILRVNDDGVGFNPEADFPGHLGLRSMRERAERLGGRLSLDSAPGQGTRLTIQIPIAPLPTDARPAPDPTEARPPAETL